MKSSVKIRIVGLVFNLLCIACVPYAKAQLRGNSDSLMISTGGFLWNRATQYTNLSKFKGDVRDSIADAPLIRQVMFEAQQAQLHSAKNKIALLQQKSDSCLRNSNTLLLHYFASTINRYIDSPYVTPSNWDSLSHVFVYPKGMLMPVKTDTLVFFGSFSDTITNASFTVLLDSNNVQSEWKQSFQYSLAIDDTLSYTTLAVGIPLPLILDSSYFRHILYFKVQKGNQTFYSSYAFNYLRSSVVFPSPDQIVSINSTVPFKGKMASLELGIWKSCLNTVGFNQPVIIVEGFDPQNSRTLLSSISPSNNLYCISNASVTNHTNMLDSLRAYGHDVLIVDFKDGGTYVERNALALVEALNYINLHKEGKDELTLVGASMGGLISRYALLYMERHQLDHHCKLWISFDSPHKGANVPIGIQMMIDFIYDNLSQMPYAIQKQVPPLRDQVLNCPAAREMLVTHYTEVKKGFYGPCPEYHTLYDTLNSWGFPSCRKVALSDGNYNGGDQGFNAGQNLVYFQLPLYPLLINMQANAVAMGSQSQQIFNGAIKLFVKGIPVNISKATYSTNVGNGIDNASGGSNTFHIDVANSLGISTSQNALGNCLMQEDNFVPVSSSLALQNAVNYQTPISSLMPNVSYLGMSHTSATSPFDVTYCMKNYYSSSRNTTINNAPHILGGFDLDMMQLLSGEMMSRTFFMQNIIWNSMHEIEAIDVVAGRNVSNRFLPGDFECKLSADVEVKAVDKIHLQDGVKIIHPVNCHLTSLSNLYDAQCIQVASSQAYKTSTRQSSEQKNTAPLHALVQKSLIQIYPNPSNGFYVIRFDSNMADIQVTDVFGKVIIRQASFHSGDNLNLENYPDGLYFISFINKSSLSAKILKQSI